jgi:cellulose synthase (UDP-forming)
VREIGGFQPTRAEDHLDTVVLAAHGYKGVFVPELIAVGEGPRDFATYLRQQFAWAYSMIQIFFQHTPRLIRRYTPAQAFQFLFCQSWYTLWSLSLAVLWVLPAVALLAHRPIASVHLLTFLAYFAPLMLASSLMWCETRRWFQPSAVRLSWRGIVLEVARWPVVLWALVNVIAGVKRPYMITPKGVAGRTPGRLRILAPYVALALLQIAAAWAFYATAGGGGIRGYYGLALINAVIGLGVVGTIAVLEARQTYSELGGGWAMARAMTSVFLTVALLAGLLSVSAVALWEPMTRAFA